MSDQLTEPCSPESFGHPIGDPLKAGRPNQPIKQHWRIVIGNRSQQAR
jgi:hypothetical protein